MPRVEREIRELPCALSDEEQQDCAMRLAQALQERATAVARHKLACEDHRRVLKDLAAEIEAMSHVVATGYELREVEVEVRRDLDRKVVERVRLDTDEVIDRQRLRGAELQDDLPLGTVSVRDLERDAEESTERPPKRKRKAEEAEAN